MARNKQPHPSFERLRTAFRDRNPESLARPMDLAALLRTPPQTMTNWAARGISEAGALAAQQRLGVSATWLLHGTGAKFIAEQSLRAMEVTPRYELDAYTVPPLISPESWMAGDGLPTTFTTTAPDDALAPSIPRGSRVLMRRLDQPETLQPGACVLVEDARGQRYMRRLSETVAGRWTAQALHGAYASLDSERDRLQIVAVMVARFTDQV